MSLAVAGAALPGTQGFGGFANEEAVSVAVLRAFLTPAALQRGATLTTFDLLGHLYYGFCDPGGGCDRDNGSSNPQISLDAATGSFTGIGGTGFFSSIPANAVSGSYGVSVDTPLYLSVFDAQHDLLATEVIDPAVVVTPEPTTLALTLSGFAVLGAAASRRRRA